MPRTTDNPGDWLREKRKSVMLGLREFSNLIGDSPSNVCNIENGNRPPWQNEAKLRRVAEVLGIQPNTDDWDTLFNITRRPGKPPADLAGIVEQSYMPVLLRTIEERQLDDDDIQRLLNYVKRNFPKRQKDEHAGQ